MKNIKFEKIILISILILSAFLRLWMIEKIPVSLFGDELDVGYHAYSLLKTGKDYYGNFLPIDFHSIAEYRTPLYLYSAIPTVTLFGISPLGVRLPAVIFGVIGVFGMYLLVNDLVKNSRLGLIAAFLLAISPWHIQYSRGGFEVTELLAFLLLGLYFFFKSLRQNGKWLWLSVLLLTFTPWIYSTAKLFTPLLFLFLFLTWFKEILKFPKKSLIISILVGLIVGSPIIYSTLFGQGAERASYLSVFTSYSMEAEVGASRLQDALVRGEKILGLEPNLTDRVFHNKFLSWMATIGNNYFQTFSSDFLFVNGDPNPRHSINGLGEFYKIESVMLILGFAFFLFGKFPKKMKLFIFFWLIIGALPSEITRDGGTHATRLILILPPLIYLISYGIFRIASELKGKLRYIILVSYFLLLTTNSVFYLHNYYIHNPWNSERWWHAGYSDAIKTIKSIDKDYDRVIISMAGEPAWIFFAGWYQYPPLLWQKYFPIDNVVELKGFGKVSHIDKFYFGNFNVSGQSIYDLGKYIDNKTLYLAVAKEVGADLIQEPDRAPSDLKLIKAISYPSGNPAFYLFTKI